MYGPARGFHPFHTGKAVVGRRRPWAGVTVRSGSLSSTARSARLLGETNWPSEFEYNDCPLKKPQLG